MSAAAENSPLTFAVAGAGARGTVFAEWLHDNVGPRCLVAVAEPDPARRDHVAKLFGLPPDMCFATWEELLDRPRLADVLVNTTMDAHHHGSAVLAMRLGYHMMLEKPVATDLAHAAEIARVAGETGRVVSVCHSLRYNAAYAEVRRLIRSGVIGEVVTYDQLEAVENFHQSHSFVRGNWGNEGRSTYMLMAKSCHDIDIIADLMGAPCASVTSYGKLTYFTPANAPEGAPDRCTDGCPHEAVCPYHSVTAYARGGYFARQAGLEGLDRLALVEKLRTSPYGKCVFHTDNDVVDHQVVALEFQGGATATFTMTAFTPFGGRYVRVHGTKGYIDAKIDQNKVDLWEFWAGNRHTVIDVPQRGGTHGGGDAEVMRALIRAVRREDPQGVPTTPAESLRTLAVVVAAERSRREKRQVQMKEVYDEAEAAARRSAAAPENG